MATRQLDDLAQPFHGWRECATYYFPSIRKRTPEEQAIHDVEAKRAALGIPPVAQLDRQAQIMQLMTKADEIAKATKRVKAKRAPREYDPAGVGLNDPHRHR